MDTIHTLLTHAKTIAVVGLSSKPDRASYQVAAYMQQHGYRIIPVNPKEDTVLGEQGYATLRDVPVHIDIVNVFRAAKDVPPIIDEAIAIGADAIWLQLEITHPDAEARARSAGLVVVANRCIKIDHARRTRTV
jgi:predicted CoA-binding protein